jgi:hypothetical protein
MLSIGEHCRANQTGYDFLHTGKLFGMRETTGLGRHSKMADALLE